eukprot:CAMPEP_0116897752 /NCGR_PEP_ID=MMETSP0467-20121206/6649_1 /TAXON_ID=283647 /ORGANISM="Mesodinium pulex, Strain SPMC105" /LENGTH=398 /DNA_ID=CAMNT_0004569543 /DNA_START=921 /DNA_END=2117 /DNA_ORIENTATION=+
MALPLFDAGSHQGAPPVAFFLFFAQLFFLNFAFFFLSESFLLFHPFFNAFNHFFDHSVDLESFGLFLDSNQVAKSIFVQHVIQMVFEFFFEKHQILSHLDHRKVRFDVQNFVNLANYHFADIDIVVSLLSVAGVQSQELVPDEGLEGLPVFVAAAADADGLQDAAALELAERIVVLKHIGFLEAVTLYAPDLAGVRCRQGLNEVVQLGFEPVGDALLGVQRLGSLANELLHLGAVEFLDGAIVGLHQSQERNVFPALVGVLLYESTCILCDRPRKVFDGVFDAELVFHAGLHVGVLEAVDGLTDVQVFAGLADAIVVDDVEDGSLTQFGFQILILIRSRSVLFAVFLSNARNQLKDGTVVVVSDVLPVYVLTDLGFLFFLENVFVEVSLEPFIGEVDE